VANPNELGQLGSYITVDAVVGIVSIGSSVSIATTTGTITAQEINSNNIFNPFLLMGA